MLLQLWLLVISVVIATNNLLTSTNNLLFGTSVVDALLKPMAGTPGALGPPFIPSPNFAQAFFGSFLSLGSQQKVKSISILTALFLLIVVNMC